MQINIAYLTLDNSDTNMVCCMTNNATISEEWQQVLEDQPILTDNADIWLTVDAVVIMCVCVCVCVGACLCVNVPRMCVFMSVPLG